MKKIITKISLLPLLTLFTKKKTVRKHSDISIANKLKWESAMKNEEEKVKGYKVNRSDRRPPLAFTKLSDEQLLCFAQNMAAKLHGHPDYSVPQITLTELDVLMDDLQFANLVMKQNRTPVSLDHLNKVRQAMINCLRYIKMKYKVL